MTAPRQSRVLALFDSTAWLLMLPPGLFLYYIDSAMLATVVQWLLIAPILAGITVIVSRVIFPQVSITWLVQQVEEGNQAAGLLAAALVIFVGMVFIGMVVWGRA